MDQIRETYFKNSVIFINEDIANKYKEERDDITKFFEHDERLEMRTKEEIIGKNTIDSFEDLLSEHMCKKSVTQVENLREIFEPTFER